LCVRSSRKNPKSKIQKKSKYKSKYLHSCGAALASSTIRFPCYLTPRDLDKELKYGLGIIIDAELKYHEHYKVNIS
jgi:hypothetical protein